LKHENGINIVQFEFGISSRAFKTYFIDVFNFLKDRDFETFVLYPDSLKSIEDPVLVDLHYPYGNFVSVKKSLIREVKGVIEIV
jgi:hypothetical protein